MKKYLKPDARAFPVFKHPQCYNVLLFILLNQYYALPFTPYVAKGKAYVIAGMKKVSNDQELVQSEPKSCP